MNTNIRFAATAARVTTGDAAADALKAAVAGLPGGGLGHFFAPTKTAVEDKSHAKHLANFALWLLAGRPDNMKAPYSSKTLSVAEVVVRDALPNFRLAANAKGQEGVLVCPLTLNKDVTQLSKVAAQLDKGDWASFAPALRAKVVRALKLKAPAAAWYWHSQSANTAAWLAEHGAQALFVQGRMSEMIALVRQLDAETIKDNSNLGLWTAWVELADYRLDDCARSIQRLRGKPGALEPAMRYRLTLLPSRRRPWCCKGWI